MQESFRNAARRHLEDSHLLLDEQRWDNAVYLAGYVVECCFKVLVEQYFSREDQGAMKKFGHDLKELEGKAFERLSLLYPALARQFPLVKAQDTILTENHPERRYAKSGLWTKEEVTKALKCTKYIYQETILKLVLDGDISREEL